MRRDAWLAARPAYVRCVVAVSAGVSLLLALTRGQDFNWDQRNYHLSTPHLLLQGDFWGSVAPSGIQSYYNPAVLLAQYLLFAHLPAPLAASLLALCQSAVFVLAGLICARIAPPDRSGHAGAFLGFLLCLASPMALSEVGTSFIDLLTAIPVLAGFLLLMRPAGAGVAVLAGGLLGVAAGLKLTNAVYVLGAAGFLLAWPLRWRAALGLGVGVPGGFAAVAGEWHLRIWQRFGNPFFPYYNNLFHSPDAAAASLVDGRFPARSAWDIVGFPLYWLLGGSPRPGLLSPTSEVTLHDARFALALVLGGAVLCCWRRIRRVEGGGLLVAWLLVYLAWLFAFGIHRYAVGMEVMLGAVLLGLCWRLPGARWRWAALGLACVVTLARFHVPNWGHLPWRAQWQGIAEAPVRLPSGSVVFLVGKPVGYVAASLCCDLRIVGLSGEFDLARTAAGSLPLQVAAALGAAPGAWLVTQGELAAPERALLAGYGLAPTSECQVITPAKVAFSLCKLSG